jgi:hypothetical protein
MDIPPGATVVAVEPLCRYTIEGFVQSPVSPDCMLHYRDYIETDIKLSDPYYIGDPIGRYVYLLLYPDQKMTKIRYNLDEIFADIKAYDSTFIVPVTKYSPATISMPIQMPIVKPPAGFPDLSHVSMPIQMPIIKPSAGFPDLSMPIQMPIIKPPVTFNIQRPPIGILYPRPGVISPPSGNWHYPIVRENAGMETAPATTRTINSDTVTTVVVETTKVTINLQKAGKE